MNHYLEAILDDMIADCITSRHGVKYVYMTDEINNHFHYIVSRINSLIMTTMFSSSSSYFTGTYKLTTRNKLVLFNDSVIDISDNTKLAVLTGKSGIKQYIINNWSSIDTKIQKQIAEQIMPRSTYIGTEIIFIR